MDFSFSDDQRMTRELLEGFLRDRSGKPGEIWQALASELGLLGAALPEASGGLGGGDVADMIVMEQIGVTRASLPYLETVVIGGGLLARSASPLAAALIDGIIAGSVRFAFAYAEGPHAAYRPPTITVARRDGAGYRLDGRKITVSGMELATHLLITARLDDGETGIFVVDIAAPEVSAQRYPTIDGEQAADIVLNKIELAEAALVARGNDAVAHAVDAALAAMCAELVGLMRAMLSQTLEHATNRRQFGVTLSSFQVLQHRMTDMFIALEQSVSMSYFATLSLGKPRAARQAAVSAAKAFIAGASRSVGQAAIQIYGAIGVTDELPLGHYFRRATALQIALGSIDHHVDRYAQASFTVPA